MFEELEIANNTLFLFFSDNGPSLRWGASAGERSARPCVCCLYGFVLYASTVFSYAFVRLSLFISYAFVRLCTKR